MVGCRRDRRTSRRALSSAGKSIVRKAVAVLLKSDKFSPRQTPQSRLLEFPRGALRLQFAAIDTVAKHLRYDFISAKEVDLKTMRLFLRARFCVDATNVCLRIRIGTSSSHGAKLTEQSPQSTSQTCRGAAAERVRNRQVPGTPFLIVLVSWQQCIARMPFRAKPGD